MLGEYLDDAFNSWLGEALSCCTPSMKHHGGAINRERRVEKHMTILHDQQPRLIPQPVSDPRPSTSRPLLDRSRSYASQVSKRGAFSVRRKLNAYNGIHSRRPQIGRPIQISDPSDFQHVGMAIPRRTDRFRPLQLSIYMPDNRLSPILPHFREFRDDDSVLTYPARAVMTHTRSDSAMSSFTIPRKPLNSSVAGLDRRRSVRNSVDEHESPSSTSSEWALQPLKPPPRIPESPSTQELMAALETQLPRAPPVARLTTIAEPPSLIRAAEQYGRVQSALIERQELDDQLKKLDTIIEQRRSLYLSQSSRGTSIYNHPQGTQRSHHESRPHPPPNRQETTPPPSLPTSREVSTPIERPQTAPVKPAVRMPHRAIDFSASAAFNSHPPISREISHYTDHIRNTSLILPTTNHRHPSHSFSRPHSSHVGVAQPPPPLPLMLHSPQPLLSRKSLTGGAKSRTTSFSRSRVSNWLFPSINNNYSAPGDQHKRNVSNDSVTNSPKPVTSKEGFYQCIDYNAPALQSNGSLSTVLTQDASFVSEEGEEEGTRTLGTTNWSPGSSPGFRGEDLVGMGKEMELRGGGVEMRGFDGDVASGDRGFERRLGEEGLGQAWQVVPNRTSVGVAF